MKQCLVKFHLTEYLLFEDPNESVRIDHDDFNKYLLKWDHHEVKVFKDTNNILCTFWTDRFKLKLEKDKKYGLLPQCLL